MKRFNEKGRLGFPCSEKGKEKEKTDQEEGFVVEECYCQNGHSLISPRAVFNEQYIWNCLEGKIPEPDRYDLSEPGLRLQVENNT